MPVALSALLAASAALKPAFSVEYRSRFERRIDHDFSQTANDNRSDLIQRIRLGATAQVAPKVKAMAQYQYAHTLSWTADKNSSDDASDLLVGCLNVDFKPWDLTVGRQKVTWGDGRLIGSAEWQNLSRSLDAVDINGPAGEAFVGRVGVSLNRPVNARIAAVQAHTKLGDTSYIYKLDSDASHDIRLSTLDHRLTGHVQGWTYGVEAAIQGGRVNGKDQEAWAYHAEVSRPIGKGLTFGLEANAASGGVRADKVRTFDSLYPSPHRLYGLSDTSGWSNMNQFVAGLAYLPDKANRYSLRYLSTSLRDASDAWYGVNGAANPSAGGKFVDPTGSSGKEIGQEIDLEATHLMDKHTTLSAGLAWVVPGNFVKTISGDNRTQFFGYLQLAGKY